MIETLREQSSGASVALVADFKAMKVKDITKLRKELKSNARCTVAKNTLAMQAFAGTDFAHLESALVGPSLIVFGHGDASETIKLFLKARKKYDPKLTLKGGAMIGEAKALSPEDIEAIGKLPSREMILAQIAGALTATPASIASAINQIIGSIGELTVKVAEQKAN